MAPVRIARPTHLSPGRRLWVTRILRLVSSTPAGNQANCFCLLPETPGCSRTRTGGPSGGSDIGGKEFGSNSDSDAGMKVWLLLSATIFVCSLGCTGARQYPDAWEYKVI